MPPLEQGGEDDPGRVALDEEESLRVVGPAAEHLREHGGEVDANDAGDEDGQQGPCLEPHHHRAIPTSPGGHGAGNGEAPGAGHGASGSGEGRCSAVRTMAIIEPPW